MAWNNLATPFPVWRELKPWPCSHNIPILLLATPFPVWRELKHKPCLFHRLFRYYPCYPLSRLKGIETFIWISFTRVRNRQLATPFPVWRELKLEVFCDLGIDALLATPFPVWRELKQGSLQIHRFSFETACYPLSRLKGIETEFMNIVCVRIWREVLLPPFPFEGNWNRSSRTRLAISLGLLPPFPFEGNWNGADIYLNSVAWQDLLPPFPFEGNWNSRIP